MFLLVYMFNAVFEYDLFTCFTILLVLHDS